MFESSKNFLRLPKTVSEFRESFETSWELYFRLPKSTRHIGDMFKDSENYLRYPKTLHKKKKEMVEENSGPSGPSYLIKRKAF